MKTKNFILLLVGLFSLFLAFTSTGFAYRKLVYDTEEFAIYIDIRDDHTIWTADNFSDEPIRISFIPEYFYSNFDRWDHAHKVTKKLPADKSDIHVHTHNSGYDYYISDARVSQLHRHESPFKNKD